MLRVQQWTAVLALGIVMTLMGCKADQNTFATPNASIGSGDGSGTVDPTAGFKLMLKSKTGVEALLHKFGDFAASCEIAKDAASPTAINCLLNMMEYDLFYYGFDMQMTVPAGLCNFLEEVPYRYFKFEPGFGPSTMSVSVVDGAMTTCTVDGVAGTVDAASNLCTSGEVTLGATGEKQCVYDYSNVNYGTENGPNCCFGNGNLNVTTTVNGAGGPETTSTSSKVDWGGSLAACSESPHDYVEGWPVNSKNMAVTRVSELGGASLQMTTKFPGVLKLNSEKLRTGYHGVYLHANMYDWPAYQVDPSTWSTTARVPRAFNPVKDRGAVLPTNRTVNGTSFSNLGYGQYQYRCLGPAGELKHSINLWVQSWNTKEQYLAYAGNSTQVGTGDYAAADPYVQGTAGVDCSAVSSSNSCNNFWSFDDLMIDIGAGDYTSYLFPNEPSRGSP